MDVRTVNVTRYVTPLREGGSLPAIVEADDDGMYVLAPAQIVKKSRSLGDSCEIISGKLDAVDTTNYKNLSELVGHVINLHTHNRVEELRAVFDVVERLHIEGDGYVKEAAHHRILDVASA